MNGGVRVCTPTGSHGMWLAERVGLGSGQRLPGVSHAIFLCRPVLWTNRAQLSARSVLL